jgi:hypothetical protein
MPTAEQIAQAEARMRHAHHELLDYVERPEPREVDIERHKRLADNLKRRTDEYVSLIAQLGR